MNAETIIRLEREALEKWNNGNPDGYLSLYDKEVTYFDPFHSQRVDGHGEMTKMYEELRGQIKVDRYEIINPNVEISEQMAVLSYNLVSYSNDEVERWNCTVVFRKQTENTWKTIHTHWSLIKQNK